MSFGHPEAVSTNIVSIKLTIDTLRSGQRVGKHMSRRRGSIELYYADGEVRTVWFLPGHNPFRYEFGVGNRFFAVPRSTFIDSLVALGVDVTKIELE